MLQSGTGGERFEPSSSAVEASKRIGDNLCRERAVVIMPADACRPMA